MIRVALFLLTCTAMMGMGPVAAQDAPSESQGPEAKAIREILSAGAPPVIDIDAALGADAVAALRSVYAARDDRPIWFGAGDTAAAHALLDRLTQSDLTIGNNLQPLLDAARARIMQPDTASRATADLLLTALYGAAARALRPKAAPPGLGAALDELSQSTDIASLLREPEPPKVETPPPETPVAEAPKVETPQAETPPIEVPKTETPKAETQPPTGRTFRVVELKKEWPTVPDGPKLQRGDSGPRVEALRRRLMASGDLKADAPGAAFDTALKSAVEHFQARHGLPADGVAGATTLAALNVPAKERSASLMNNIWRSGDRKWGDRYLAVNIPAARYRLVEGGRTVAEGPVTLGAAATPTPAMDSSIDRIELRPSYRIPQSVADRQLWPRQEEDALYFVNHGIRVTDDGLRQVPGAGNPLGVAKLLLAGNDRIAIHGTPSGQQAQAAFDLPERHTSLGCIALPDIAALVKPLLASDPAWSQGRIDGALAVGGTQVVALAQPLPVHFVYDTAWIDEDGTLQFRDDVYGWDKQMPSTDPNTIAEPCGS